MQDLCALPFLLGTIVAVMFLDRRACLKILTAASGRSMSGTLASVDFHASMAAVKRANDTPSLFEQDIGLLLEAVDALEDDDHEFAESHYIYCHACKFV